MFADIFFDSAVAAEERGVKERTLQNVHKYVFCDPNTRRLAKHCPHIDPRIEQAMSSFRDTSRRQDTYKAKGAFKHDELRRRREEAQVEIRRQKREESMAKRRNLNMHQVSDAPDSEEEDEAVDGLDMKITSELPAMVQGVLSDNLDQQLEATTKFRKLLSKAVSYTHLTLPTIYSV